MRFFYDEERYKKGQPNKRVRNGKNDIKGY